MRKEPKEYAKELVEKFNPYAFVSEWSSDPEKDILETAKSIAIICIEELITAIPWEHGRQSAEEFSYYSSVKKAINEIV